MKALWTHFFNPKGRSTRMHYWGVMALCGFSFFLVGFLVGVVLPESMQKDDIIASVMIPYLLILLYIISVIHIRRLHDLGRSGIYFLWIILALAPLMVVGIALIPWIRGCLFAKGVPGRNKFGDDPLGRTFENWRQESRPRIQREVQAQFDAVPEVRIHFKRIKALGYEDAQIKELLFAVCAVKLWREARREDYFYQDYIGDLSRLPECPALPS